MKFFLIYILFYLSFSYYQKKHYKHSLFVELSPINNFRFKQSPLIVSNDNINLNEDIGPGPVFKKGWLKYLILTQNDSRSFNQFNKNQAFYEQATHKNYQNIAKDDYGVLEVPDSFHFFFYLTSDSLYIVSARKNSIAKTLKIVNFKTDNLKINEYLSGVEDQGNYQEGYCFKLRVKNCGFSEFLILCSDSLAEKKDWMKRISILQNRCQNPNPHIINEAVIESNIKSSNQYESNYTENIAYLPQSKIDGRWIILHDWSTCTLACGGGTQTLHRFCIPPSDGGAPCVGNSIVNRSCNIQLCPNLRVITEEKVAPTKIKMMRISKRPQRYETCIIKEGDLEVIKESLKQFGQSPRIPARVILNNKTLMVFESEDYQTVIFSINLENLKTIENFPEDSENCFVLKDCTADNKITLCGFANSKEKSSQQKREWIKQIYFFRDKCQEEDNNYTDEILILKKRALDEEAMERRAHNLDKNQKKYKKVEEKLEKLQNLAMIAATKESKYEKMAESEEIEREEKEEKELEKRYEEEKIQQEFYDRQKKSNALNDAYEKSNIIFDNEEEIEEAKSELKNLLKSKREKQNRKLILMRKQAERRKQQILDKIALLRNKSNLKIPCSKQKIDFQCYDDINKDKRTNFCNLNFKKIDEQISCQEEENFCFMCCEALLNDYEEEIEKCEKTCNQKELKKENGKLQKHKEFKNESCNPNKNGSKDIKVLKK